MNNIMAINENEVAELRLLMENYLNEKKAQKQKDIIKKKLSEEEKYKQFEENEAKFDFVNWLDSASKRVKSLQFVTHAVKFIHPDAKSSMFFDNIKDCINSDSDDSLQYVSSHLALCDPNFKEDVVGNASSLDIYSFLSLEFNTKTIFQRMKTADVNLLRALPGTEEQKEQWINAFLDVEKPEKHAYTHTLAKQVYFPVKSNSKLDDTVYHLLSPLFPSSLAYILYKKISENKTIKIAEIKKIKEKKEKEEKGEVIEESPKRSYFEIYDLAMQNFGGANKQNISQLNIKFANGVYLLPSLPPIWKSKSLRKILNTENIFNVIERKKSFINICDTLIYFLVKNAKKDNFDIRQYRKDRVSDIIDVCFFHIERLQYELDSCWSDDAKCTLSKVQKSWLDPKKYLTKDNEYSLAEEDRRAISAKFAHCLNKNLNERFKKSSVPTIGDEEFCEWKKCFDEKLKENLKNLRNYLENQFAIQKQEE